MELSGPSSSQGSVREFKTGTQRREYIIEWFPWLRHFRIVDVNPAVARDLAETWVHETNASSWRRSFVTE